MEENLEDNFKETAEEAASNGPEGFEYLARLQRFYRDNCEPCGSQRCTGVYDEEWRDGCVLYKKKFCK